MNPEQPTLNKKTRIDFSVPRILLSDAFTLPEEQVKVDPVPLDDEPFVTIEYYKNQLDPLAVIRIDDSAERSNLDSITVEKRTSNSPPKIRGHEKSVEVESANKGEVFVQSYGDSLQESVRYQPSTMIFEPESTLALRQLLGMEQKISRNSYSVKSERHAESSSDDPTVFNQTIQSKEWGMQAGFGDDDASALLSKSVGIRNVKVYHPFAYHMEDFPISSLPNCDLLQRCSPPKAVSYEKPVEVNEDTNRDDVFVISDDDSSLQEYVTCKPSRATNEHQITLTSNQLHDVEPNKRTKSNANEKSKGDGERSSTKAKSLSQAGVSEAFMNDEGGDYVICVEEETPDELMQEIFQQLLQNMAERRRASAELRQKKTAEINLAKQVVRVIMQPGSRLIQNSSPEANSSPIRAESSVHPRCDLLSPKQRREAVRAESSLAKRLIQLLSRGDSFQHAIQELKSAAHNSRPASPPKRRNVNNFCGGPGADRVTLAHQSKPAPAKRVRQKNSRVGALDHLGQTQPLRPQSRPTASPIRPLLPALPSYSHAFSRPDGYDRATCESFSHEPIHDGQSLMISELAFPVLHPPSPSEYQRGKDRTCSSLPSAVHPSHLLPPISFTVFEGQDFPSPEVSNTIEQTFLNRNVPTDTSNSTCRILSFENF